MMRSILVCMVGALLLATLPMMAETIEDEIDLTAVYQSLASMNALLKSLVEAQSISEFNNDLAALGDAYEAFTGLLPTIHGLPFSMWAALIGELGGVLEMAAGVTEDSTWDDLEPIGEAIARAKLMKETFEVFLAQTAAPCAAGRALVIVYPGFDAHDLRATISDLLQDGKCVTVTWRVPEAYSVLGLDANAAMKQLVYTALGTTFKGNREFTIDPYADETGTGYDDVARVGDATLQPHVQQHPTSAHANFSDAAIASGIVAGEPVRLGQNPVLVYDQPAGPWVQLQDVCGPTTATMPVYSPLGTIVETFDFDTNPADAGVDCFSTSSSMDHFNLHHPCYWLPGTYWVEVWVDDIHCATHPFTVTAPEQPPFVHDEEVRVASGEAASGNVLDNDFDPNGDPLTVSAWGEPPVGELTGLPDGLFVCNPPVDFSGEFSITYHVTDAKTDPVLGILKVVVEE